MHKLLGKTPIKIEVTRNDSDKIRMYFSDGSVATWCHIQDCCETVTIEDINGDWFDLINTPLLVADERIEPGTYTFYTFRSIKGSVDVRWFGYSSGYYSESVDFFYEEPQN